LLRSGVFKSGKYKGRKVSDLVKTVAIPGLGTGVGGIGYSTCAHQVKRAIDDILLNKYKMPNSWAEASENHQLQYTDSPTRLQY
ncbi:MAG: Appr-1-p processing protein, partial [bacterium]|nr:Appr-1-p processing protein [bacterium]